MEGQHPGCAFTDADRMSVEGQTAALHGNRRMPALPSVEMPASIQANP